jgi:hypothetical protein
VNSRKEKSEKRKSGWPLALYRVRPRILFCFLLSIFCLAACGTPGDPRAPQPPVPVAVSDLSARQQGERVVLTFTMPQKTIEGDALESAPDIEIFRGFFRAGATPDEKTPVALVYTVPATLVDTYLREGRVEFADPLSPEVLARRAGEQALYRVRTRASKRRASDDSNTVAVRVYPVPAPIRDAAGNVTAGAIELRWTPPERTSSGTAVSVSGFRVYRAELEPGAKDAAAGQMQLLGVSPTPAYRDVQFEFGKTYVYSVRSVAQYELDSVESGDSNTLRIEARDTFAPAAPQNLVIVPVAATASVPAHLELSWSISPEADVAGYNVYRSEMGAADTTPVKQNQELLLTPTFRDMSVVAGRGYTYTVTAVDRAGNESAPSAPANASVNAEKNE